MKGRYAASKRAVMGRYKRGEGRIHGPLPANLFCVLSFFGGMFFMLLNMPDIKRTT